MGFFLKREDSHGDGLGSLEELRLRPLLVLHIHISPSTSSGQRNCASWASQPQKSVTFRPQPGGETTKSIRDMWRHRQKKVAYNINKCDKNTLRFGQGCSSLLEYDIYFSLIMSTEMLHSRFVISCRTDYFVDRGFFNILLLFFWTGDVTNIFNFNDTWLTFWFIYIDYIYSLYIYILYI
jgi:hypothetical protein